MSDLLLPGFSAREPGATPFDRQFFAKNFHSEEPPACELYGKGEVPVVELELANGETPDIYYFEAFTRDYLVAMVFEDPPSCEAFYRTYIRYETIFRVNVRYYDPPKRSIGFKPARTPIELTPGETEISAIAAERQTPPESA